MPGIKYKGTDGQWHLLNNVMVAPINVVQTTGTSTADVMSQSAVTEAVSGINETLSNYYDKDDIDTLVGSGFTSSSITEVIIENEDIVSAALNDLGDKKADTSAVTDAISEAISGKADVDGEYQELTAGNIVGTFSDNNAQFGFRPTAGAVDIESGKADNGAKITHIKGNTVAWNQLVRNGNFADGTTGWSTNNVNVTILNNTASVTTTGSNVEIFLTDAIGFINGHKYYLSSVTGGNTGFELGILINNSWPIKLANNGTTSRKSGIFTASTSINTNIQYRRFNTDDGTVATISNTILIDLTLIYGAGNEPSTPEAFEADYMKLFGKPLSYEAYDEGSLIPVNMSGIKTVGFNAWDEEWELGLLVYDLNNPNFGQELASNNQIRSKYIDVVPNTTYYLKYSETASGIFVFCYDSNKNPIRYWMYVNAKNKTFTTASEARYVRFYCTIDYGTTYNHDICINLAHSNARNGEYEAHWDSLCSIPITSIKGRLNGSGDIMTVFPDGLKKAGSVYDEIIRRGEQTIGIKRVGSVDLGTLTFTVWGGGLDNLFKSGQLTDIKFSNTRNYCSAKYLPYYQFFDYVHDIVYTTSSYLCVNDLAFTDASEFNAYNAQNHPILYYELAEPQEYVLDFTLPQVYDVDDYGTEEIVYSDGVQGVAPTLDIEYGINAPDTIKNLPHSYVSAIGEQEFNVGQKERARLNIGIDNSYARKTDFSLEDLHNAVAEGNLEKYGLKVGDQKTINGHTYVIAGLNPMKGTVTPYRLNQNHVGLIVIPHTTTKWNVSGNTYQSTYTYATSGGTWTDGAGAGYANSDLHHYMTETLLPIVKTDLGSYASGILKHHKLYSTAVNTSGYNRFGSAGGCSSSWAWYENQEICALSEVQVYGSIVWSSSGYDTGEACRQLDVFRVYNMNEIFGGEYPWLRDVASASYACFVGRTGNANCGTASYASCVAALILFA